MKAVIHVNNAAHQKEHAAAMRAGLERHGIKVEFAPRNTPRPCTFAVVWGVKQPRVIKSGRPFLVMERGHIQPRMEWTSCGWNGLGRRATYPIIADGGERWSRHFAHHLRPWKFKGEYALIFGQVVGDAALYGVDFHKWAQKAADSLSARWAVLHYRPHPLTARHGDVWRPKGASMLNGSLDEALAGAAVAVSFNSTASVEAVLAGVPTVTCDEGAMAWPVTSHRLSDPLTCPDRAEWCHRLAWTQWRLDEIADGSAWDALKTCREMA